MGQALASALSVQSAEEFEIDARDDFGRRVDRIPLKKTGTDYYFDATSAFFHLAPTLKSISPAELAWEVARSFKVWMLMPEKYPSAEVENAIDTPISEPFEFVPENYILSRFTWDTQFNGWYIMTEFVEG